MCRCRAKKGWGVIPRPRHSVSIAFASKLCPDLIMQPHPVSEVKP